MIYRPNIQRFLDDVKALDLPRRDDPMPKNSPMPGAQVWTILRDGHTADAVKVWPNGVLTWQGQIITIGRARGLLGLGAR